MEDGASQYIEKNRQLEKELDWAKEMADRLDRHNQSLQARTHGAVHSRMVPYGHPNAGGRCSARTGG